MYLFMTAVLNSALNRSLIYIRCLRYKNTRTEIEISSTNYYSPKTGLTTKVSNLGFTLNTNYNQLDSTLQMQLEFWCYSFSLSKDTKRGLFIQ